MGRAVNCAAHVSQIRLIMVAGWMGFFVWTELGLDPKRESDRESDTGLGGLDLRRSRRLQGGRSKGVQVPAAGRR